ncbi:sigma-70 family RNA polymerase sigma factor [Streptomyces sp. TS71-3]|uniref:sigma-70 family RNA polymerase sigma factor n=1 Tax=Streptomyces sp. TS71-3 TaxID=2733862 RepID=UPI001BB43CCF|nr:sigma-70 family RNA polymerase sigma factor [Streptomyces sp. TS71-3]
MNTTTAADVSTAGGHKGLLNTLMTDHTTALLGYAERLLHDRHLAEDVVQETLIRAWRHRERLHGMDTSVRGWLFTVARNIVIDRLRSAAVRRETVGTDDRDVPQPDHDESVLHSIEATALLRQLSHDHREVLLHIYLCGRTVQETARIIGIPAGTVKSRQHYALRKLRATSGTASETGRTPGRTAERATARGTGTVSRVG